MTVHKLSQSYAVVNSGKIHDEWYPRFWDSMTQSSVNRESFDPHKPQGALVASDSFQMVIFATKYETLHPYFAKNITFSNFVQS